MMKDVLDSTKSIDSKGFVNPSRLRGNQNTGIAAVGSGPQEVDVRHTRAVSAPLASVEQLVHARR